MILYPVTTNKRIFDSFLSSKTSIACSTRFLFDHKGLEWFLRQKCSSGRSILKSLSRKAKTVLLAQKMLQNFQCIGVECIRARASQWGPGAVRLPYGIAWSLAVACSESSAVLRSRAVWRGVPSPRHAVKTVRRRCRPGGGRSR